MSGGWVVRVRKILQHTYYRAMIPAWRRSFAPRIVEVNLKGCEYRFFVSSPQAATWYDPPKPHTIVEYRWVLENVDGENAVIVDAGAHHGHYSLLFAMSRKQPKRVVSIEPLPSNCAIIEVNAALNDANIEIVQAAVAPTEGVSHILPRPNSRLVSGLGVRASTLPLSKVGAQASIVKLDIEGEEFRILPSAIDDLQDVGTWIVEVHPRYGDAAILANEFVARGFRVSFLDHAANKVRRFDPGSDIQRPTSMFFQRR